jgi:hypothetical protein
MIFTDANGKVIVMDLDSKNGTYINGVKLGAKSPVFEGDTLTFGKIHCELLEAVDTEEYLAQDQETQLYDELQSEKVYIPRQQNENEVLIDDEYCDIVFNDQNFVPNFNQPINKLSVNPEHFIENEEFEEGYDILQKNDGHCIQVSTSMNGCLLEQYYFPLQDGSINAIVGKKKNHVSIDILKAEGSLPLFKVVNGILEINELEDFSISQKNMDLNSPDVVVLTRGTYQIFIEVSDVPSKLMHISSFKRDKNFVLDTAKKFASVILPMLLLLLVDFTIEKEKPLKKLSIIYKKPTTANVDNKKMASENPNNTKKDTGHKSTKQPDKKISHSKAGAKKKPKKSKQKKVAKAKAAKAKPTKTAKAKTKTYKFKMATNVNSLFSTSKSSAVSDSRSKSAVATTSSAAGSLNTKVNGTSSAEVGQMGKDSNGRSTASYGSKGLSSKAGRNTAYIQTKTVVLGSMDPELLRKILQQYLPQFRHCYQQELAYNSEDIKGIVDLNFEIAASGKVGKIKVRAKDSRFSKRGLNCMSKILAIIDFPRPKGGGRVAVRQPLSFFSEKEKG